MTSSYWDFFSVWENFFLLHNNPNYTRILSVLVGVLFTYLWKDSCFTHLLGMVESQAKRPINCPFFPTLSLCLCDMRLELFTFPIGIATAGVRGSWPLLFSHLLLRHSRIKEESSFSQEVCWRFITQGMFFAIPSYSSYAPPSLKMLVKICFSCSI